MKSLKGVCRILQMEMWITNKPTKFKSFVRDQGFDGGLAFHVYYARHTQGQIYVLRKALN